MMSFFLANSNNYAQWLPGLRGHMSIARVSNHLASSMYHSFFEHYPILMLPVSRHGEQEGRDTHRLRDRNGAPVLCFRCGTSALPGGLAAAAIPSVKRARRASITTKPEDWKNIISCDYCSLHWHLDCLDPPLPTLPPFNKKWMCPNHVDQILVSFKI